MAIAELDVLDALRKVKDPDLGKDIVTLGFVKDIKICDGNVSFTIELTTPACPVREKMKQEAQKYVLALPGVRNVDVRMTAQVSQTASGRKAQLIPQVRNIVPVASGKGGVGKSTVSANLALALSKLGSKVGLMDADVYGPSIPTIMGIKVQPHMTGQKIMPVEQYGIKIISMGFFLREGEAVIWRGPMLHKAVEQFLGNVDWGELDYLIADLPPGTGDIQLSLCQTIPLTGAAIVSTPQDVALKVAEKAIIMSDKLNCPVLGLIENMSYFICPKCHSREEIFSYGGARRYCQQHGIPFLGEIPLATKIRTSSDEGKPVVIQSPDSEISKAFFEVAENLAAQISVQNYGATSLKPMPHEIRQISPTQLRITWKDGHVSTYDAFHLRNNCTCAVCVDELTGKKRLEERMIPKDISIINLSTVGRYALHIQFSDGHGSGIYTFEHLRKLCSC